MIKDIYAKIKPTSNILDSYCFFFIIIISIKARTTPLTIPNQLYIRNSINSFINKKNKAMHNIVLFNIN